MLLLRSACNPQNRRNFENTSSCVYHAPFEEKWDYLDETLYLFPRYYVSKNQFYTFNIGNNVLKIYKLPPPPSEAHFRPPFADFTTKYGCCACCPIH